MSHAATHYSRPSAPRRLYWSSPICRLRTAATNRCPWRLVVAHPRADRRPVRWRQLSFPSTIRMACCGCCCLLGPRRSVAIWGLAARCVCSWAINDPADTALATPRSWRADFLFTHGRAKRPSLCCREPGYYRSWCDGPGGTAAWRQRHRRPGQGREHGPPSEWALVTLGS